MTKKTIILAPITKLMSYVSLWKKFAIIMTVCFVGYLPGCYFIYSTLQTSKVTTLHERVGLDYFTKAYDSYIPLVDLFSSTGSKGSSRPISSIENKFSELRLLNTQNNEEFQSSSEHQSILNALVSVEKNGDSANQQQALAAIISKYIELFDKVVAQSELALDPNIDSYFLMDVSTIKLPKLLSDYVLFAQSSEQLMQTKSDVDKSRQIVYATRVEDAIDNIIQSLNKVAGTSKAMQEYSQKTIDGLDQIKRQVKTVVKDGVSASVTQEEFHDAQIRIQETNLSGFLLLKTLLDNRLNALGTTVWIIWPLVILNIKWHLNFGNRLLSEMYRWFWMRYYLKAFGLLFLINQWYRHVPCYVAKQEWSHHLTGMLTGYLAKENPDLFAHR